MQPGISFQDEEHSPTNVFYTRGRQFILLSLGHAFLSGINNPIVMITLAAVEKEGMLSRASSRGRVREGAALCLLGDHPIAKVLEPNTAESIETAD